MRIEINEATPAAPRTLSCGDELQIRLAENPTTGYRWHFEQSGTAVLALVEDRFEMGGGAPGAGGKRLVRFIAQQAGSVVLEASARRPFEPAERSPTRRSYPFTIR
jgi:predicted secreted protein